MSASIQTLIDGLDNEVYPKTKTSAVYDENNNTLDSIIANKLGKYASGSSDWDNAPTQDSTKAVTSGGIYQAINDVKDDLGNPSSASSVTGADAFSKISTLNSDLANKQNKTWNVICNTSLATGAWTTINLSDHISYYNELYIRVFGYNTFVPVSDFVNTSSASPIVVGTNGSLDANIIMAGYLTDVKIHVYAGTTVSINPSPIIVMAR